MANGMHQYDATPNALVPSTELAIMQAIAMWGGGEIVTGAGVKHVLEAFQMLKSKALTELDLATLQYYYYNSSVQFNSQFVIAGPVGMDVGLQTQPPHVRLELILDSAGDIIQTGACFTTSDPFPEAAPLNPPNQV